MAQVMLTERDNASRLDNENPMRTRVLVKKTWAGDWEEKRYMEVLQVRKGMWPSGDMAKLQYHAGRIHRADRASNSEADIVFDPLSLEGYYVKIETLGTLAGSAGTDADANGENETASELNTEQGETLFVGVITRHDDQIFRKPGANDPSGNVQQIEAMGLEYLLDRITITEHYVMNAGVTEAANQVRTSTRPWAFNQGMRFGLSSRGNRSDSTFDGLDGNSYVFAPTTNTWTTAQIIDYLFNWFNVTPGFELAGQVGLLDEVYRGEGRFHGMSVKRAIETMIDRRRGIGCYTHVTDDDEVMLVIVSLLDEDAGTFEANPYPFEIDLDNEQGVEDVSVERGLHSMYRSVTVRGALAKVMFTAEGQGVSAGVTVLAPGWTDAEEQNYRTVDVGTAEENDLERATQKYEHVYRRYVITPDWNWKIKAKPITPVFDNRAVYRFGLDTDEANTALSVPNWGGTLMRQLLTFEEDGDELVREPQLAAPFAVVKDSITGDYMPLHRADAYDYPPMGLRIMDSQMGIELTGGYNHIMSKGLWHDVTPASTDTNNQPIFSILDLKVTVAAETDVRPTVLEEIEPVSGDGEQIKVPEAVGHLLIDVPDVEFWSIAPGTVTDVEEGQLVRYGAINPVLRDDTARLRKIADLAKSWYRKQRVVVNVTMGRVTLDAQVGTMLVAVFGNQGYADVNTPVSEVVHDFVQFKTMIRTQYAELDFVGMA